MAETRGKKGKKANWQVQLGGREVVLGSLGVMGLLLMSFILGTLAGRGEIFRVLSNWGLMTPEASRTVQAWPPSSPPAAAPAPQPVSPPPQAPAVPAAPLVPVPAQPVPASVTPAPPPETKPAPAPQSPAPVKKKAASPKNTKAKDEGAPKIHKHVASRLTFQNSMDPAANKPAGDKTKPKIAPPKKSTSQVFVAKFRDGRKARAKLAEMQKQGDKVTLKEGKDGDGVYFALYRQVTVTPAAAGAAAPKRPPQKPGTPPR